MTFLGLDSFERDTVFADLVAGALNAELIRVESIDPGLGTRRFFRLHLHASEDRRGGGSVPSSVIARVEGDDDTQKRAAGVTAEPPLEPLRAFMSQNGIPVPDRYAADEERGIELLEDVGSLSLERAVAEAEPGERVSLYRDACGLIPRLQGLRDPEPPLPAFARRLDRALISSKADRFVRWALPWHLDRPASAGEDEIVREAFCRIADACEAAPQRLAHRDYKAANIHILPSGGAAGRDRGRLVLIDLQGAFMAPPEYDLVCLLRDSHILLASEEVAARCEEIRPALPDAPDKTEFDERFSLLTLCRVAKDSAHYIHAATSAGDRRYLPFLPNAQTVLQDAATKSAGLGREFERLADLIHSLGTSKATPIETQERPEGSSPDASRRLR